MTVVQAVPAHAEGASGVTVNISSTGSGNLLLIAAVMTNNSSTLSLSYGGTSQTATALQHPTGASDQLQTWYVPNCASGTTSVTITRNSGTGQFAALVVEVSGIVTSSPLDVSTSSGSQAANSTLSTGTTGTTAQASEFWWAVFADKSVSTGGSAPTYSTLSSGWTADVTAGSTATGASTNVSIYDATQTASATGTANATLAASSSASTNEGMGVVATFKIASGGGTTPSGSDSAALTDTANQVSVTGPTDAASLSESASIAQPTSSSEAATLAEQAAIKLLQTDSATFAEQVAIAVQVAASDTAALAEPTLQGPLQVSSQNDHWLVDQRGRAVLLAGSHTWDDLQDEDTSSSPAAVDFNGYVSFLKSHNQNFTIVWKKDLPTFFSWGAGGTWTVAGPWPWKRTGPGNASDGLPKFDLTQLDQTFFDRLRQRVQILLDNNIWAVVMLFDGLGLLSNRGTTDGYPFTNNVSGGQNNVNSIDDGYDGTSNKTASMTMSSANSITTVQDAYVHKMIDTLHDMPNVIWEVSEEADPSIETFWQGHMIDLVHSYESSQGYPAHPVVDTCRNGPTDGTSPTIYTGHGDIAANAARVSTTNNTTRNHKVLLNDSDHTFFDGPSWASSNQTWRNWLWENVCAAASPTFMDPYLVNWTNRNSPSGVSNGVGTSVDTRWNFLRDNLGYAAQLCARMGLVNMSPAGSLSSTTFCLANTSLPKREYLVYAPAGGAFTVDLSGTSNETVFFEWLDPTVGTYTQGGPIAGGSATQSFTPPWGASNDAVLHIWALEGTDAASLAEGATVTSVSGSNVSSSDSATLAEQAATSSNLAGSDTAALAEQIKLALSATESAQLGESMAMALARQDTATLQELVSVAIAIADAATLSESATVTAQTSTSDSATLTDSASKSQSGNNPTDTDSATLADSASSTAAVSTTDIGALAEQAAIKLGAADVAALTEQIGLGLIAADSAALTEQLAVAVASAATDSAALADVQAAVNAALQVLEAVSLGESASVSVVSANSKAATDSAGLGERTTIQLYLVDLVFVVGQPVASWSAGAPADSWAVGTPQ